MFRCSVELVARFFSVLQNDVSHLELQVNPSGHNMAEVPL